MYGRTWATHWPVSIVGSGAAPGMSVLDPRELEPRVLRLVIANPLDSADARLFDVASSSSGQ